MDYSIFKPGDKVRGKGVYQYITGTVLFSHEKCLLLEREKRALPGQYIRIEFEKIPERTRRFSNVWQDSVAPRVTGWVWDTREKALNDRPSVTRFIGMFEQVFEDGKLVETKYHPD